MKLLVFCLFLPVMVCSYSVQQLSAEPKIVFVEGFLSDAECNHLIELAKPALVRSKVVDSSRKHGEKVDPRRSSEGMFLPQHSSDKIVNKIEKRIQELTHYKIENGEAIHILHYGKGAEYQPHFDFFDARTPGGAACLARGGQRVISLIMYLNTPDQGGETIFPRVGISVTPKKGCAVLFYNCTPNGKEDPLSFHGGAPVKEGEKWIATKWIRKGAFY